MSALLELPETKRVPEQKVADRKEEANGFEVQESPLPSDFEDDSEDGEDDFFNVRAPTARDTWLMKLPAMGDIGSDAKGGGTSANNTSRMRMALFSDGKMKWMMYCMHFIVAISIGLILYWAVGFYNILLSKYGMSQSDYTLLLSALSAGCTSSMFIPLHTIFPSEYLPSFLLVLLSVVSVIQCIFIDSFPVLLVCHFIDGFIFCTVNALSNAFMGRWFYFQTTSAALGVMNTVPYTMVLVTFQCEKWGMSAKTYLFAIAGILFIAALCFAGTVAYENQFKQKFRKSITSFYGTDSPRGDPAADEHGGDHFPEESDDESQSDSNSEGAASNSVFTTDFLVLLAMAAIGGLQITYISTMPFIMFRDNFNDDEIVDAAQVKSMVMIFGGFPVGLLVDKLGHRALVNALTNVIAILYWLPFLTNQSWVQYPMVGFFSCIDSAWVASLYALPLSMVASESMGFAMILVNGIQWFSCIFGLPLVSYIQESYGRFWMGTFILGMYVLGFFLSIYIYLFGKNQAVANAGDSAKSTESGRLVRQFDQMSQVNLMMQENLKRTSIFLEKRKSSAGSQEVDHGAYECVLKA